MATFTATPLYAYQRGINHNVLVTEFESGKEQRKYLGVRPDVDGRLPGYTGGNQGDRDVLQRPQGQLRGVHMDAAGGKRYFSPVRGR